MSKNTSDVASSKGGHRIELLMLAFLVLAGGSVAQVKSSNEGVEQVGRTAGLLESRKAQYPSWVSVPAATHEDGTVNWELLGPKAHETFERLTRQPPVDFSAWKGLRELGGVLEEKRADGTKRRWYLYGAATANSMRRGDEWESLEELARSARGVFVGTVVGVEEGFFRGAPGSLLTIEVEETLKKDGPLPLGGVLYMYYPSARFSIGSLNFLIDSPVYPRRPAIGDKLLVSADQESPDLHGLTIVPRPDGIFLAASSGSGKAQKTKSDSRSVIVDDLSDVVETLRILLKRGEGR